MNLKPTYAELEKRVIELEKQVKELLARPQIVNHNHYPYPAQPMWPAVPWTVPQGPCDDPPYKVIW